MNEKRTCVCRSRLPVGSGKTKPSGRIYCTSLRVRINIPRSNSINERFERVTGVKLYLLPFSVLVCSNLAFGEVDAQREICETLEKHRVEALSAVYENEPRRVFVLASYNRLFRLG
jgi:hypothetical protein